MWKIHNKQESVAVLNLLRNNEKVTVAELQAIIKGPYLAKHIWYLRKTGVSIVTHRQGKRVVAYGLGIQKSPPPKDPRASPQYQIPHTRGVGTFVDPDFDANFDNVWLDGIPEMLSMD